MNKTELIAAMAETSGLTKKDCESALSAFTGTVEKTLKAGGKVQLVGFGTFETRKRSARVARDPRTRKEIRIPASNYPAFKPGKGLKDLVK